MDGFRSRWRSWVERIRLGLARAKTVLLFVAGIFAALLAVLLYSVVVPGPHQLTEKEVGDTVAQVMASATPPPAFSSQVYRVIQPSLVLIETESSNANGDEGGGLGSGVVVDMFGDILTSLHVVDHATSIKVTFADGTETSAGIIISQPENDIAVLSPAQLPTVLVPATLGNPNAMHVGDQVFAVGNPFGLYSSMSAGVISGFNRYFQPTSSSQRLEGLIQIDAAVNPGNSGGPLLNRDGHVIAIVTGIVNPTDQRVFIGIGFAVPITVAVSGLGSPPY